MIQFYEILWEQYKRRKGFWTHRPAKEYQILSSSMNAVLLEELVKKFFAFCGIWRCSVRKRSLLVSILSQLNPLLSLAYLVDIQSNIILSPTPRSSKWFLQVSRLTFCLHISSIHITCPTYLIVLDLMTLIMFNEEYRLWNSSLCSFLHHPLSITLLGPYSQAPSVSLLPFGRETKFHTHIKQQVKLQFF
jgi:hypothetical protein